MVPEEAGFYRSMIFPENRFPLFGIMLYRHSIFVTS
jgi:hypothetical protein